MTTSEILHRAADHIEQTNERSIVYILHEVTDYLPEHRENREEAMRLLQLKTDKTIYPWAGDVSLAKITDTLRSIAKEIQ